MDGKKFKMIDEAFVCINCKTKVNPLNYSARDHCPNCLCSRHFDINPGDRASTCGGLLIPIDGEKGKNDTWKIIYKCTKCGIIKKNKMAIDDNYDLLIKIMSEKDIN